MIRVWHVTAPTGRQTIRRGTDADARRWAESERARVSDGTVAYDRRPTDASNEQAARAARRRQRRRERRA